MDAQIITIDGKRGTGKSRLAINLRRCFGCGVLDIGPVFRLMTWFILKGMAKVPEESCALLSKLWEQQGTLSILLHCAGEMSATKIELDGQDLESELWRPEVDDYLPVISQDKAIVENLGRLARLRVSSSPTVIVGRNTGEHLFPDAVLKIRLIADDAVRTNRKLRQLREVTSADASLDIERSEPLLTQLDYEGYLTIDTSCLTPEQVFGRAKEIIAHRLSWKEVGA